jgi:hypothetical protein
MVPVIPTLKRLRQEFKASLRYIMMPYLKKGGKKRYLLCI